MKTPLSSVLHKFLPFTLVLLLALVWVTPAFAAQSLCTSNGGTWDGVDADNGTCTYPAGSSIAIAACGSDGFPYVITYVADVEEKAECVGQGQTQVSSEGPVEAGFTLRLGGEKNGFVEFFAGSCDQNCTIDTNIPNLAEDSIIVTPLATLYVRVDGGAGSGSYRVCFENTTAGRVSIYRSIGGVWYPIAGPSGNGLVCATASGDGAFYLGGK